MDLTSAEGFIDPFEHEPPVVSSERSESPPEAEPTDERAQGAPEAEPLLEPSLIDFWRPVQKPAPPSPQPERAEEWDELYLPSFEPQIEALETRIRRAVRTAADQAVEQALRRLLDGY